MAVNHTPADRTKTAGARLAGWLNQLESANAGILNEISTVMESIDGGEANATDTTKMSGTQAAYNFLSAGSGANAAAVSAIGQLQAIRAVLTAGGAQAAFSQAFNRLRG